MSQDNPLLADDTLPAFSQIRPEHVAPTIEAILADYRAGIDALTAPGAAQDFASVMLTQERLEQRLARAWAGEPSAFRPLGGTARSTGRRGGTYGTRSS